MHYQPSDSVSYMRHHVPSRLLSGRMLIYAFVWCLQGAMASGIKYYKNIFRDRPPELLALLMKPLQVRSQPLRRVLYAWLAT